MPKIAVYKFLAFFIVSYDLKERLHLHIIKTKGRKSRVAKIWLNPIQVFDPGDLTEKEINLAVKLIEINQDEIKSKILNFAKGKKSKPISLKLK